MKTWPVPKTNWWCCTCSRRAAAGQDHAGRQRHRVRTTARRPRRCSTPIERFLKRHDLNFRTIWVVGSPSVEVVRVAKREKVHMIVMGTHGHGVFGRALMGSVAQSVVSECDIPVLLVK